ncbi:hypothetical protein Taro_044636 [Colocasia esculenta]|uniref:Strictosidine synthase conserved region domain-containing protein n=1 Tax=Colocasia esculenta TaxID=4460 RepID=A0A843X5P0_COLES|nr:hypothetical protein [Colocasia esculenta]
MANPAPPPTTATSSGGGTAVLLCLLAVCVSLLGSALVATHPAAAFDAAPLPDDYTGGTTVPVRERHGHILGASEAVGEGLLPGPEDLAYDAGSGFLYTGCDDGWIRRVKLPDPEGEPPSAAEVEEWVRVGGRPLGVAFGPGKQLLVAEAYKGLLAVAEDGAVRLLADEAEGLPFLLTDGVDVSADGAVYFTDASHKYNLSVHILDVMEGRPYGRLLRYDPATDTTAVLLRGLYFANGVAISPDQSSLVFCETVLRRCRRYYIAGEKKGTVERFLDNLPGFPDNIRYDGEGHFWIGLSAGKSRSWDVVQRYPWVRKMMAAALQLHMVHGWLPRLLKGGGVLCASLEGEALALYTDPELMLVTGGLKIGKHLYYGSLAGHHIGRIRLDKLAAAAGGR